MLVAVLYKVSTDTLAGLVVGYKTLELDGKLFLEIVEEMSGLEELVFLVIGSTVPGVALIEVEETEEEFVEGEETTVLAEKDKTEEDLVINEFSTKEEEVLVTESNVLGVYVKLSVELS